MERIAAPFDYPLRLKGIKWGLLVCVNLWLLSFPANAQDVTLGSTTKYAGGNRWEWTAFIRASPQTLTRINCIEYHLQETLDRPDERICERGDPNKAFAISQSSWGEFTLLMDILYRDGSTEVLKYPLKFDAPPRAEVPASLRNVAEQDGPKRWLWTAFIDAEPEVLARIHCVEYTLGGHLL